MSSSISTLRPATTPPHRRLGALKLESEKAAEVTSNSTEQEHTKPTKKRFLSPYVLTGSLAFLVLGYFLGPWIMVRVLLITERARVDKLMDIEVSDINEEASGQPEPGLAEEGGDS